MNPTTQNLTDAREEALYRQMEKLEEACEAQYDAASLQAMVCRMYDMAGLAKKRTYRMKSLCERALRRLMSIATDPQWPGTTDAITAAEATITAARLTDYHAQLFNGNPMTAKE